LVVSHPAIKIRKIDTAKSKTLFFSIKLLLLLSTALIFLWCAPYLNNRSPQIIPDR